MKAVILAGGMGTRISEETILKPKPLIEIGGMPILWHIMKIYTSFGINDFVICCGYKSSMIKDYFSKYFLYRSDVTFNMTENQMEVHKNHVEPWRVTVIDTGADTMTGGRLKRAKDYIGSETFCFTYGDGLSDVNIAKLIDFHKAQKKLATVTASKHQSRFGVISADESIVTQFSEKPIMENSWMNSGFFVMEPEVLDGIEGDDTVFEKEPLQRLVRIGQLCAYRHDGFFQGMDSLRDKMFLEDLWKNGNAPWRMWS
jgi:glucose-1-phosphate cytidylyltransferase